MKNIQEKPIYWHALLDAVRWIFFVQLGTYKHVIIAGWFFKVAFKPLELWVIFGSSSSPQKQSMGVTRSKHIPAVYPIPIPRSQIPPHPNPTIFHISASVYQQNFGSPPLSTSDIVKVWQIICQNRIAKTWCSPPARERCSAGAPGTSGDNLFKSKCRAITIN